jgi:hypothetical protein
MYCSACGVAVTQGLSYCNYCGAKLPVKSDGASRSPEVRPELLVSAISGIFILGLVAIIVLMGVMKAVLGLPVDRVLAFSLVPFLLMLLLEFVFIRLLLRGKRSASEASDAATPKGPATKELDAAHARTLPEHMPSVTEHTTRAFDPIYRKPTAK